MRNISQAKLLKLNLPVPPLPLQSLFVERLTDLRSIVAQQECSLAIAQKLERSLMAQLLG